MTDQEHLEILRKGVGVWNEWRRNNPEVSVDFKGAHLRQNLQGYDLRLANLMGANFCEADFWEDIYPSTNLRGANLSKANLTNAMMRHADLRDANLSGAYLTNANLGKADLSGANLNHAYLTKANLSEANLSGATLQNADLRQADFSGADLGNADLSGADLRRTVLVNTKIGGANISDSWVYAVNVWDLIGEFEDQRDLIITPRTETPVITVDNIKIAQFVYLILNNREIRGVLEALMSKAVLILGRFSIEGRKAILDALRNKLREFNLAPIVFDFDRLDNKDFTETIKTLAGLSFFVIADITNPRSTPLELQAVVPDYQIPFVPILQKGEESFSMMQDLQTKYDWVLDTLEYESLDELIKVLKPAIIDPAIEKHNELRLIKAMEPKIRSAKDFLEK